MGSHRYRGAIWGVPVLVAALAASPGLPAASASTHAPASPPASTGSGQLGLIQPTNGPLPAKAKKITLITGDVVSYAGPGQIQVRPAPGDNPAVFTRMTRNGDTYVIPGGAMNAIATGKLDMSLFDVTYLAANGYTDQASKQIPLIVSFRGRPSGTLAARSEALDRRTAALGDLASRPLPLTAINATAVRVGKARVSNFWSALATGDLARVWLDRRVHTDLSRNMRQIGVPRAWAAGYDGKGVKVAILDTGVDFTHPDLSGEVAASHNFTEDPDATDGFGHGTHVAGILAGSGAASGGEYRGVAPGASLLIGKVLDHAGTGDDSWVMAGMQWAVSQGARVISMSLSDNDVNDGTDPMSEMIDALSASSKALFVVAAANSGPGIETVSAPGTADAALTVAAVDSSDATAPFSSRGPRFGDWALKPDISAPGVDITAARAAGTQLGPIVDGQYVTLSGTSMATPHVAGSAAILAQEHPQWTGQQIKQALMSTAHADGAPAWEQGSGRLDIGRAATAQVFASGNIDFGKLAYPQTAPVTKPLVYTNYSGTPVTLSLKASLTAYHGTPARGELTLSRNSLTVPAHGSATVEVTFDPVKGGDATYFGGEIQARNASGSVQLSDAVGAFVEPKTATLSGTVVAPAGARNISYLGWAVFRVDDQDQFNNYYQPAQPGQPTMQLTSYVGEWAVEALVVWNDASGAQNVALVTDPQINLTGDTHVTLDLNKAVQVTVRTPHPLQRWHGTIGIQRSTTVPGQLVDSYIVLGYGNPVKVWMLPTRKVSDGTLREYEQYLLGPNRIQMTAEGMTSLTLHPLYSWYDTVKMLNGRLRLPLADGGDGTAAGLKGKDVKGKLALVNLADVCPDPSNCDVTYYANAIAERVAAVAKAGATAFLGYETSQLQFLGPHAPFFDGVVYPIPAIGVPAAEGQALAGALGRHSVTMLVDGQASTPYVDALDFQSQGRIPPSLSHKVGPGNLLAEVNRDHADNPATAAHWWSVLQLDHSSTGADPLVLNVRAPGGVTAYLGPASRDVLWDSDVFLTYDTPAGAPATQGSGPIDTREFFVTHPGRVTYDWAQGPVVSSAPRVSPRVLKAGWTACLACRAGDYYTPLFGMTDDGTATGELSWSLRNGAPGAPQQDVFHMYRDGKEIPQTNELYCPEGYCFFFLPSFKLTPGPGQYRLIEDYTSEFPMARYGDRIHTEWTFGSQRPARSSSPYDSCPSDFLFDLGQRSWLNPGNDAPCESASQLYLGYDLGLSLSNRLPAGSVRQVTVTAYQTTMLGAGAPKVTSLKLWETYNDGKTWIPVQVKASGNGAYSARLVNPRISQTSDGTVGLRAQATDSAGDTTTQTIHDAYGLSAS